MDRASHHHWGSSLSLTLGWGRQTVLKKGINDIKKVLASGGMLALICWGWGWGWPPRELGLGGHHRWVEKKMKDK